MFFFYCNFKTLLEYRIRKIRGECLCFNSTLWKRKITSVIGAFSITSRKYESKSGDFRKNRKKCAFR